MKGKLIKYNHFYALQIDSDIIAVSLDKETQSHTVNYKYSLSKQNCDELFEVVDVKKLAEEEIPYSSSTTINVQRMRFIHGFNKAIELNKDKLFTIEDMEEAIQFGLDGMYGYETGEDGTTKNQMKRFIQSLQQPTEIEVEIEIEPEYIRMGGVKGVKGSSTKLSNPAYGCKKIDENGCLILKRI
jgi:hypothetical protein